MGDYRLHAVVGYREHIRFTQIYAVVIRAAPIFIDDGMPASRILSHSASFRID